MNGPPPGVDQAPGVVEGSGRSLGVGVPVVPGKMAGIAELMAKVPGLKLGSDERVLGVELAEGVGIFKEEVLGEGWVWLDELARETRGNYEAMMEQAKSGKVVKAVGERVAVTEGFAEWVKETAGRGPKYL